MSTTKEFYRPLNEAWRRHFFSLIEFHVQNRRSQISIWWMHLEGEFKKLIIFTYENDKKTTWIQKLNWGKCYFMSSWFLWLNKYALVFFKQNYVTTHDIKSVYHQFIESLHFIRWTDLGHSFYSYMLMDAGR